MREHGVDLYSTENEKSSVVERWNRTMKKKMLNYISTNSTRSYLPVLNDLLHQYNTTRNSSTKMTPTDASLKKHETKVCLPCDRHCPGSATESASPRRKASLRRGLRPAGRKKSSRFPKS